MPTDPIELPDLRAYLRERHPSAGIARVDAGTDEANNLTVVIYAARLGVLIGKQGRTLLAMKEDLSSLLEPIRARLEPARSVPEGHRRADEDLAQNGHLPEQNDPFDAHSGLGPLRINLVEIRRAELEPLLVADRVAQQISAGVDLEAALPRLAEMVIRAGGASVQVVVRRASDGERLAGHERQGESEPTERRSEQLELSHGGERLIVEVEIGTVA